MALVLQTEALTYTYPGATAPVLQNINITLKSGELLLLAGNCGSGKSTLLKCISGLIPHHLEGAIQGRVLLGEVDLARCDPTRIIKSIGVIWQNVEAQLLHHKVEDELAFGMENLGFPVPEIEAGIETVQFLLEHAPNQRISALSGGQKQRLAIAAALTTRPPLLLLDEPLANLDPPSTRRLLNYLRKLCRQGTAIVLAEHRLDLIAPYAHWITFLVNGKAFTRKTDFCQKDHVNVSCTESANLSSTIKSSNRAAAPVEIKNNQDDLQVAREVATPEVSTNNKPLLVIENLQVGYGRQRVLDNVNLTLTAGESAVILGNNGSGKSTLLKTLCGLKDKTKVRFDTFKVNSKNVKKLPVKLTKEVALVLQNPNHQLFMNTVWGELSFNCSDSVKVEELLALFDLNELRDRHPYSLSQGQKRLLALAAALAQQPKLLLLDEPTIGQDNKSLQKIIDILNKIRMLYQTVIITATHDRRAAEAIGEKIIILHKGSPPVQGGMNLLEKFFG